MSTPFQQPSKYKISQSYSPSFPKDLNNSYTWYQNEAQNISNGLYYETLIGHLIIDKLATKIIGKGLIPMASPEISLLGWTEDQVKNFCSQAEALYRLIANEKSFDWYNQDAISQLQQKAIKMIFNSGDLLLHLGFRKKNGQSVPYVQLISGRLVQNPGQVQDTKNLVGGVYRNNKGQPVAYSVMVVGEYLEDTYEFKKVYKYNLTTGREEFDLITLDSSESGVVRGIPRLTTAKDDILQISKLKELHLTKAVIQSLFTVVIEKDVQKTEESISFKDRVLASAMPQNEAEQVDESKEAVILNSGNVVELEPGEKMKAIETALQSNDFSTALESLLSLVAANAGLSYEELLGKYNSSYSASRATINDSEKTYSKIRDEFISKFLNPIWQLVIDYGVLSGQIDAPGYFDSELIRKAIYGVTWTGVNPTQVDPTKDVKAYTEAIDSGLCTHEYASKMLYGLDFEEVAERLKIEKEMMDENVKKQ